MAFNQLVLPTKIQLDEKTVTPFYGRIIAEPYESGYGHTVGNSLRRILLSGLDGSAVTAVRVRGAVHEYSTIPNVKEDVINILLNLKKLRVKLEGKNREYVYLTASKPGKVTAKDIAEVSGVEIINKDLEIANLEQGGKLELEIEISQGKGYVPAEDLSKIQRPAGFIPVDAIFSPILKVHYDVEPARVGQKTDYDRLVIQITTDGTLEPAKALHKAAVLLSQSLHIFTIEGEEVNAAAPETEPLSTTGSVSGVSAVNSKVEELLNQSVEFIELSSRSINCLKSEGVNTVKDLVSKTEDDLKMIKNFGTRSLDEVKERLAEMNLSLGMKF
ncbi:DNA-directed RNA polymerase, alpha subunit [Elusimicrobium minutum Pei191]|uniref:DNA-directed RNA polymerase subunit alpha n=1 Tax=Elusimicrobium minutum (strain Pei191) TaxID=445932 RepID=B2KEJ3_ELUMP|nr:DNA-directed RNA polymerase subunit alpha [Elusimicrobium minutum]ACC98939.1 DNA-directed RNA polymerase, alpha subunit [Elusimicrobium minutum Pei191]